MEGCCYHHLHLFLLPARRMDVMAPLSTAFIVQPWSDRLKEESQHTNHDGTKWWKESASSLSALGCLDFTWGKIKNPYLVKSLLLPTTLFIPTLPWHSRGQHHNKDTECGDMKQPGKNVTLSRENLFSSKQWLWRHSLSTVCTAEDGPSLKCGNRNRNSYENGL